MLGNRQHLIRLALGLFAIALFASILIGCKEHSNVLPVGALGQMPNQPREPVALGTSTATLTGYVKAKGSGQPIGNITVELILEQTLLRQTRTTSDGRFTFSSVAPALYDLVVARNSTNFASATYVVQVFSNGTTAPASPEILLNEIIATDPVQRKFPISGYIYDESTSKPIPLQSVILWSGNAEVNSASTDSDGKFSFPDVAPGNYILEIRQTPQYSSVPRMSIELKPTGVLVPPAIIGLKPVSVKTWTMRGVVKSGSNKEPLPLVPVFMGGNQVATTTSDGQFFVLAHSGVFFEFTIGRDNSPYYPAKAGFYLKPDGTTSPELAEIFLTPNPLQNVGKTVFGTITDSFTGAPIEFVTCILTGHGNCLTDRFGRFRFDNVPLGIHQISFSKNGFQKLSAGFSLTSGGTIPPELSYQMIYNQETGKGSIAGRYLDPIDNSVPVDSWVLLAEYEWKTQPYVIVEEGKTKTLEFSNWELNTEPIKVTSLETSNDTDPNRIGTFKFTHLDPLKKYLVYIGKKGQGIPSTMVEYPSGTKIFWKALSKAKPPMIHVWDLVTVQSDVTTYLSYIETP